MEFVWEDFFLVVAQRSLFFLYSQRCLIALHLVPRLALRLSKHHLLLSKEYEVLYQMLVKPGGLSRVLSHKSPCGSNKHDDKSLCGHEFARDYRGHSLAANNYTDALTE